MQDRYQNENIEKKYDRKGLANDENHTSERSFPKHPWMCSNASEQWCETQTIETQLCRVGNTIQLNLDFCVWY